MPMDVSCVSWSRTRTSWTRDRTSSSSSPPSRVRRVLVANRGEIALRAIRACEELGLETVAVYSTADQDALHVRRADEAVCIGPPHARESYLNTESILEAARGSGADAVYPGYGFLAESPAFAAACRDEGLVFVGPSPEAIEAMGDKAEARRVAASAGVPTVPGTDGTASIEEALGLAAAVGYPIMVKAAAGGGGRGIRAACNEAELADLIAQAAAEAHAAFGDGAVYLEKLVVGARHVEIQVIGDSHGNLIHLFERECSLQRRRQKLLEETPSTALDAETRTAMADAALRLARAAGYENAGTVEFPLDEDGRFYFIEMNTRIQVEHPVTELVTGVDLVKEQLRVARGEALSDLVTSCHLRGCAVEVRLYAEDPRTFLPQAGTLERLRLPEGVRVDSGVREGDEIGTAYDPMIAKLIAAGDTREEAFDRLSAALRETEVGGVTTNLPFLRWLVGHPLVRAGRVTTAFLTENAPLSEPPAAAPAAVWSEPWRLNLPSQPTRPAPSVDG